jgi:hypothetical protein
MFNVGDIVRIGIQRYTVVDINTDTRVAVTPSGSTSIHRWHSQDMFTLDVPVGPPPSVLTGMTQFLKDMKEKQQHETSI